MKRRKLVFMCILAFAINLTVCNTALAQRAIENATEFTQKIVEREEDESDRRSSDANSNIEWQDTDGSDDTGSEGQSNQEIQQGQ